MAGVDDTGESDGDVPCTGVPVEAADTSQRATMPVTSATTTLRTTFMAPPQPS